jgi:hypothetical protein
MFFYNTVFFLNKIAEEPARNQGQRGRVKEKLHKLAQNIENAGDHYIKYDDEDRIKTMCIWAIHEYGEMAYDEYRQLRDIRQGLGIYMQQGVDEYNKWRETEPAKAAVAKCSEDVKLYLERDKVREQNEKEVQRARQKVDRDAASAREAAEKRALETRRAENAAKQEKTKREKILEESGFNAILARVESEISQLESDAGGLTRHRAADALSTCMQQAKKEFIEGKCSLVEDQHVFQGAVYHGVVAAHPKLKSERWDDVFTKIMSAIISLGGLVRYGTGREALGLFSGKVDLSKKLDKLLVDFKTEFGDVAPQVFDVDGNPVAEAKSVLENITPSAPPLPDEDTDPYQKK